MKKTILLIVLIILSFEMKAGDVPTFSYKHLDDDVSFNLVADKINIRLIEPLTQTQLFDKVKDSRLVADENDKGYSNQIWIVQLDKSYSMDDLNKLITDLDNNSFVDYASPLLDYNGDMVAMTTQIILSLNPGQGMDDFMHVMDDNVLTDLGVKENFSGSVHIIGFPKEKVSSQFDLVAALQQAKPQYVQPNLIRYMHSYSFNDPQYSSQYALTNINAPAAWTQMPGGNANIKIAVIDVGVDFSHDEFAGQLAGGYDATYYLTSSTQPPSPSSQSVANTMGGPSGNDWHGTACAGVIGAKANNGKGIVGLAYNSKIIPIRYGRNYNNTNIVISDDEMTADAISWARAQQADVISCSWGGGPPSQVIESEITAAVTTGRLGKGIPVFFAAGNDNSTILPFPAYLADVIAVAATDSGDGKAGLSNYSTYLDISAPGDGILTTDRPGAAGDNTSAGTNGDYTTVSGTSFACPYAAGLMALILSKNTGLTETDARMVIESTCSETGGYAYNTNPFYPSKKWSNELGYGRIDANAALIKAASLLPSNASAPVATISVTSPVCANSSTLGYFDVHVTGGSPIPDINYTSNFFQLSFYTDNTYLTPSPYIHSVPITVTSTAGSGIPASPTKRIYFDMTNVTATQYPLTFTFFIDVQGSSNVHTHTGTMTVTIQKMPEVTLTPQIYGCDGQSLDLTPYVSITGANIQTAYSWNMGPFSTTTPNIPAPFIDSQSGSGPIALTLTCSNGCVLTKSANVNFVNTTISGNSSPKLMCTGSASSPIGASAVTTFGSCHYSWSPATGLSNPNILNPNFTLTAAPGTYTYTLTATNNTYGCAKTAVFTVDVQSPQTTVTITPDIINPCPGHPVTLTGNINGPYSVYTSVAFSDGVNSFTTPVAGSTTGLNVSPMATTTYTLTATDPYGCVSTGTVTVAVNNSYGLSASAGPDVIGCASPLKPINSTVTGGTAPYTYQWMPGNSTTDVINVSGTPHTYTLTVTDNNGCKATDQVAVTANPAFHPDTYGPYSVVMGQAVQVLPPGVYQGAWTTGGTPPYTYEWTPHHDFVNPFAIWPTTIPLVQTIMPTLTVTDANGCQQKLNEYLLTYETPSPPEIYEESDPCSGRQICVDVNPGVGLVYKGDRDIDGRAIDLNNPSAGSIYNPEGYVTNSFTYSPAPVSTSANCATFSPGTTAVAITLTQNTTNAMPGSALQTPPTTFNYTFPLQDNARHLMIALKNNLDMVYVGTDQLLHCYTQGLYGSWNYSKIMPTNGWGSVRVEGWLAQNTNGSRVFFKGTDQHLYSILHNSSTGAWSLESYTIGVTVKSDVACRDGADEVYYVGNDNLLHRIYYASHAWHYEAITPVGGWQGISIDGSIVVEPTPGAHVFFKGNDLQLYNTWGGTLTSPNVGMTPTMNGCAGEVIYNPNSGGLYFKGFDDKIHSLQWNSGTGSWQEGVMNAATSYAVDNYLAFDPAANRLFYQAYDRSIHNIYPYNGQNYDGPIDGGYNHSVAGDVIYNTSTANGFYIGQDKEVYEFMWNGTSYTPGWYSHALWYQAPASTYAKTCTNQYRALMTAANPDDDGSGEQPAAVNELLDPNSVNVYPNPSAGQFTVEINSGTTAVIDVYDVLGNKIMSIQKEKDKSLYELDLSNSGNGIYLINILSEGKLTSKKIMIK